jgi:hypothetical protein
VGYVNQCVQLTFRGEGCSAWVRREECQNYICSGYRVGRVKEPRSAVKVMANNSCSASQTSISTEITCGILLNGTFWLGRSGWYPKVHIFNKLPKDGDAVRLLPQFEKQARFNTEEVYVFCVAFIFTNIKQSQMYLFVENELRKNTSSSKFAIWSFAKAILLSNVQISSSALLAFSFLTNLVFWRLNHWQIEARFSPHSSWVWFICWLDESISKHSYILSHPVKDWRIQNSMKKGLPSATLLSWHPLP